MFLIFDSVKIVEGPQNTGWLKVGTFSGYRHIAELIVKIAYMLPFY